MPWFNADSKMHSHPKVRLAGLEAIGLWLMAGTLAVDAGHPSYITRAELRTITTRRKPVRQLVESRLWLPDDDGWIFAGEAHFWKSVYERIAISPTLRLKVYQRDHFKCVKCGSKDDLTLDHIYPWSLGGSDTEDNLQTMCRSCNSRKGARVET